MREIESVRGVAMRVGAKGREQDLAGDGHVANCLPMLIEAVSL